MRLKTIFIMTLTLVNTYLFSQSMNEYFTVTTSTSQEWAGGAAGSGGGINYTFYITILNDAAITFDSVWITGGNALYLGTETNDADFIGGKVYTLYASQYYP